MIKKKKNLNKLKIEGTCPDIKKAIYDKATANNRFIPKLEGKK